MEVCARVRGGGRLARTSSCLTEQTDSQAIVAREVPATPLKKSGTHLLIVTFEEALMLHYIDSRRRFLQRTSAGLGVAALAALLSEKGFASPEKDPVKVPGLLGRTHFAPKA